MLTKNEENLNFLKKKIREIRLATFKAESNSLLQLPNNVISTLKTDEEGYIWFFTSCNARYAKNMEDTNFYASLEYYNKQSDSRLYIDGKATVIEDENDMRPFIMAKKKGALNYNVVLIKLKIVKAEYYEARQTVNPAFKDTIRNIFVQLFYSDTRRRFNFFETIPNDFSM